MSGKVSVVIPTKNEGISSRRCLKLQRVLVRVVVVPDKLGLGRHTGSDLRKNK